MLALLIAVAATTPSAGTVPRTELQPWAMFVGHCWRGAAPVGNGVDTHCFDTVYGGQHVRDRHEVTINGKAVYAGETLYSAEGSTVSFTYWNSLGGVGRGTATTEGSELRFSGEVRGSPEATREPLDTMWHKVEGGYEVTDAGGAKRLFKRID